jgi:hypothetical protein
MQKTLLASLLVFSAAGSVTAQTIPNAGFETWVDQVVFEEPENWATFNAAVVLFENVDGPVTQSTDAHSGTYAARVTNRISDFDDDGENDTLAGVLFTGYINVITETIVAGWAFTARPDSLVGWTKYATPGNDNYRVGVTLTKWNPVTHETDEIGTGIYTGGVAADYSRFHVAIDYVSAETPDTALIMITASEDEEVTVAGSDLFVDDLAFVSNSTAGLEIPAPTDFVVYPNPANNQLEVRNNTASQLTLSDISGKQVATFDVRNQLQVMLPTAAYENGVYLLRSDLGTTLQLVIRH